MKSTEIEILEESAQAQIQSLIHQAMNKRSLTKAKVAKNMKCDRSNISYILGGSQNLTIKTIVNILAACEFEVHFELIDRKVKT